MHVLKKMVDEGLFDYIGLSEVSAETIRRAHAVHPVSLVELEYSFITLDIERNGTLDTCAELGIPIAACVFCHASSVDLRSPAHRQPSRSRPPYRLAQESVRQCVVSALLWASSPRLAVPEGDMRHHLDRFKPENFAVNIKVPFL